MPTQTVSSNCRTSSTITAPKSCKMLAERCRYREKSHSSKFTQSVKISRETAKKKHGRNRPFNVSKHGIEYYDYGKS